MIITLQNAGKRFNREWIFKNINHVFEAGKAYAITGANGSGKSTLLQIISGAISLSEGSLKLISNKEKIIPSENIYQSISLAAPYVELIEEMTAEEFLSFHQNFKPFFEEVEVDEILDSIGLQPAADKQIRYYSSGMKQRVKLAQAIFSQAPILLLDEPCTNLDASGYDLYHELIEKYCKQKLIIVSSNDANEIDFCHERIKMGEFKKTL
jgi:ABC-type multidrug transport system ATPase subunit